MVTALCIPGKPEGGLAPGKVHRVPDHTERPGPQPWNAGVRFAYRDWVAPRPADPTPTFTVTAAGLTATESAILAALLAKVANGGER